MSINILSILIPCYNEEKAIGVILQKVVDVNCGLEKEIIIVNDNSTDNSKIAIEQFVQSHPEVSIKFLSHDKNKGKGASIRTAINNGR